MVWGSVGNVQVVVRVGVHTDVSLQARHFQMLKLFPVSKSRPKPSSLILIEEENLYLLVVSVNISTFGRHDPTMELGIINMYLAGCLYQTVILSNWGVLFLPPK